ncbi:MAG: serine/threonine protein kinase [Deltaproteobacteria bacterium]|nr:serine/threonine protein kinase [Deltaproteobacteria bacterium]
MGAVYVVEHVTTGKRRALKVMLPHLVRDQASRDRFEREARIGARIESDNVVEVVDAGVDEGTGLPFLVMELLDGVDLDHVIESHKTIPPRGVADIVDQLCDALGRGHAIGVVHSDLKPENVFLESPGAAAWPSRSRSWTSASPSSSPTRCARRGSPPRWDRPLWMAPEQTQRGAAITPTDVWALGCWSTGCSAGSRTGAAPTRPTGRSASAAWCWRVVVQPLDPASLRAREMGVAALLPAGFDGWFARCVVREQDQRFANASLAWDGLEPILGCAWSRARDARRDAGRPAVSPADAGRPDAGLVGRSLGAHRAAVVVAARRAAGGAVAHGPAAGLRVGSGRAVPDGDGARGEQAVGDDPHPARRRGGGVGARLAPALHVVSTAGRAMSTGCSPRAVWRSPRRGALRAAPARRPSRRPSLSPRAPRVSRRSWRRGRGTPQR